MTRKFVYDARVERVRLVADTGVQAVAHRSRALRWLLVALGLAASALAFDTARTVGQARGHAISAR